MDLIGERRSLRTRLMSMAGKLDTLSKRAMFAVVAAPLFAVYLITADWTYPIINDATTNSAYAWVLATEGTVFLEEYEPLEDYYGWYGWFVPAGDSVTSKYPPGAGLFAVPFYAVWRPQAQVVTTQVEELPEFFTRDLREGAGPITIPFVPIGPGAVAAAAAVALAMGFLAQAFVNLGGAGHMAVAGAYLAGLGTGAWPVAADQLWQHGPAMAWIALAFVLSDTRLVGSGFAYGAAILTRPPLAVIAAGSGLYRAVAARSLRPALLVGIGSALGLLAFLGYNWWLFGEPTVSAGYGPYFQDRFFRGELGIFTLYLRTLWDGFFSANVGVFVWSPFLLVLLPGLKAGWQSSAGWVRGSALGGVLYLLIQFKANRATGGTFLGYRYPLESLLAMAPLLFLSYRDRITHRPQLRRLFLWAGAIAVAVNGLAAIGIGLL